MRLSEETFARRILAMLPVWAFLAAMLIGHAICVRDYLGVAGSLGLRGAPESNTPLKAVYPAFAADAEVWVRHALSLTEGSSIRLRYTDIDNAPFGREVHWNSAWAWAIAGAGKLDSAVTGAPLIQAVERMTIWLPAFTLFVLMVGVSWWVTKRGGALFGIFIAVAMVGQNRLYEGYFPSYVDHHGLITSAVFCMTLGACFMGAGWWAPAGKAEGASVLPASLGEARKGALFSGIAGGFGLWFGAASVIPVIAFVGLAGLIATVAVARDQRASGATFDGGVWRLWGRSGAASSFLFYLLEYAPNHLGMRLEVNHPLYSLAWLGAGEILGATGAWVVGGYNLKQLFSRRLAFALVGVLVAPLTILIGGVKVFTVSDPFLSNLHSRHIQEFLPLWKTVQRAGWQGVFDIAIIENIALFTAIAALVVLRRRAPPLLWFAAAVFLFATCLAWWQSRWLLNASGPAVCLLAVLTCVFLKRSTARTRWFVGLAVVIAFFGVSAARRVYLARADVVAKRVSPADAYLALFRDIARVIRASQPTGDIVLLSSPNSSTGIGYFGRFKTLGTLYWENNEGLKAAGRILTAKSPGEAARLIQERKVTHIAMISEENFVVPYFSLLNPKVPLEEAKNCFGYQILVDRVLPAWLRTIPYRVPDDLKGLNVGVLLMQIAFDQSPADALYHVAMTKVEMGEHVMAERDFDELIKLVPVAPQPWLKKAELLARRNAWPESALAFTAGIQRSEPKQRNDLYAAAAATFYRQQRPAEAIQMYREGLRQSFDPNLASYLAWILATTSNAELRNGQEAVVWAEKALETNRESFTYLNALAAAMAETGKFHEAVELAERALGLARAMNDGQTLQIITARLVAYRSGKPWRE